MVPDYPHLKKLLLKVKSPSESWQPLVGISIPAAVVADYMGVMPHWQRYKPPTERRAIMLLLIDAFICMHVYSLLTRKQQLVLMACNM